MGGVIKMQIMKAFFSDCFEMHIITLLVILLLIRGAVGQDGKGAELDVAEKGKEKISTVAVALTSVPSRFKDLEHTIRSWMLQYGPPRTIVIFIPKTYQRFKKGKGAGKPRPYIDAATAMVGSKFGHYFKSGGIIFRETKNDYGPLTKFAGILEHWDTLKDTGIDFWVIGDDDVHYSHDVLRKYRAAMDGETTNISDLYTHFSEDERVFVRLDGEESARAIRHIQGVDTFAVRHALIRHHMDDENKGELHWSRFFRMIKFFHEICPASFYQDDYVLSFAFNIAGLTVTSLWDDTRVAGHIDGVSKDNHQMHMHRDVHLRETETKECITLNANAAARILRTDATGAEEL
jgi:hypothetical protein